MNRRLALVSAVTLTVMLVAGACGGTDRTGPSTSTPNAGGFAGAGDRATLSGAGSTFVAPMVQEWAKDYKSVAPGVTLNYQAVGSGAGIQQLAAKTVDFAGSDAPLKDSEQTATGGPGNVLQIPWIAGAVAVEYNLPGVTTLNLSADTVARMFAGRITRWDDAAVRADNPGTSLPTTAIQIVHRSDGSGTTQVFSDYLRTTAPDVWTFGPSSKDWPAGTPGTGAKGSDGVTAAVKQSVGAVGYAEVSYPKEVGLGVAHIRNRAGAFVIPTAESVSAAIGAATVNSDLTIAPNYLPDSPTAYALTTTTYLMYYKSSGNPAKDEALKHFATWVLTDGQRFAEGLDYAPMPTAIVAQILAAVGA